MKKLKDMSAMSPEEFRQYVKQYWAEHPEEAAKQREKQRLREQGIPFCPKCGSTAVATGARGVNATWGLFGASNTVNRCGNCGHTWKPGKK